MYGDGDYLHAADDLTCRAPTSASTCAGGSPTGAPLAYNLEGYPVSWQNTPNSPTTTVGYLDDGQGDRVEQQVTTGGTTTTTVYLGNLEEVATTGGTTTTTTYYYAGTHRVALAVNGTFSYLGADELGSASVALDASGTAQAAQLYAPYGATRYTSGTMPGSFGYTGQRSDAATGLDYYVSRYYDPAAGQFTSADTTLPGNGYDAWGLSRYAYVEGNPTTRVDADGHCWPLCTMIIGAVVGAAIAGGMDVATQAAAGNCCDWGQIGKDAAVGALSGAVSGLVGPEAGPLVRAAVDTGVAVGGQVLTNALDHKPLGDGVLLAAGIGLASSVGMGAVMEYGGRYAARALGHAAEDAEGDLAHGAEEAAGAACGLSFAPGTPVATPKGEKPIASLKVGDQVVAYDPNWGKTRTQTVEHVWINHDTDLLDVTLRSGDNRASATPGHDASERSIAHGRPARGPQALAAHLALGTLTLAAALAAPLPALTIPLRALTALTSGAPAGPARTEVIHTTANHPWLTAEHGWVRAGALRIGEPVVRADGGPAMVVAVRVVPGMAPMWDLTLDQVHTFAVGGGEYVVHNNNCNPSSRELDGNLGGEVGDGRQAHHLIPRELRSHDLASQR